MFHMFRKTEKANIDLIKNSFISDLQSFPTNTEIQMKLHFKSAKWTNSITLPNSHSR